MITAKTKLCGLIGNPVGHSMSPVIHNAAFAKAELNFAYMAFEVKKEQLAEVAAGMRALDIKGLNVTIPHKVDVIPHLDALDPLAEKIGAVNTIVNDDGVLTGHNTDATGFLRALREDGVNPEGKKVVVIGAGGAARAIAFTLAQNGATLAILNRPLEFDWAAQLAERLSQKTSATVKAAELDDETLKTELAEADILINATSVGMSPNTTETPVPATLLRPDLAVFDVVYNPVDTRLLTEARAAGAVTISGLDMFVWQGALAFELWTGQKAPVELMRKKVQEALS